jgi:hypothetical protein
MPVVIFSKAKTISVNTFVQVSGERIANKSLVTPTSLTALSGDQFTEGLIRKNNFLTTSPGAILKCLMIKSKGLRIQFWSNLSIIFLPELVNILIYET